MSIKKVFVEDWRDNTSEELYIRLNNALEPLLLLLAILNKYKYVSDKYLWTLNLFLICINEPELRLPLHTWRGYALSLEENVNLNEDKDFERIPKFLSIGDFLVDISVCLDYILQHLIDSNKDYYKVRAIKEKTLVKLSKTQIEKQIDG